MDAEHAGDLHDLKDELVQVGGHTPGQAIVVVATPAGRVVLASDAVHYYEELERDRPFSVVADVPDMYAAFDLLREMQQDAGTAIVAGHDIAGVVAFLLSDDAAYVTGEVMSAEGGATCVSTVRPSGGAGGWDTEAADRKTYG